MTPIRIGASWARTSLRPRPTVATIAAEQDAQAAYWQSLNMQQKVKRNAQQPLPGQSYGYSTKT
jgi:hypothetical protein